MTETKRGPGRPATQTKEDRRKQLREGKKVFRSKAKTNGKVRLDAMVDSKTKAAIVAYRETNRMNSIGEAIDAMLSS